MEDLDDLLAQEKAMRQEQQDDDEQQERNVRQRSFGNVPLAQQAGPSQAGPSQQAGYSSPPRADTRAADAQPLVSPGKTVSSQVGLAPGRASHFAAS